MTTQFLTVDQVHEHQGSTDDLDADDPGLNDDTAEGDDESNGYDDYTSPTAFDGDTGQMTAEQRYAYVCLLADRYVAADTNVKAWQVIVRDHELLRSRLHELYLDLVIDTEREVARKEQIPNDDGLIDGHRTLLRSATRSLEETFLLAHTRMRFHRGKQRGDRRVLVDRDELIADLMRYIKVDAGNQSAPKKRASKAVDVLITERILIDRGEERYEIHPVVETLMPVTAVRNLVDHFREHRRNNAAATSGHELLTDSDPTETDELLKFARTDEGDPT